MKKKYITLEELLALKGTGTPIFNEKSKKTYIKFVGDIICTYNIKDDSIKDVGSSIIDMDKLYILEPEEAEIKNFVTGLYKTRNGRVAFVSYIDEYHIVGMILDDVWATKWNLDGTFRGLDGTFHGKEALDLVEYVGEAK